MTSPLATAPSAIQSNREKLVEITLAILGPDPHTGGAPHPDTVDALVDGFIACCALSNARPVKYAHEPWREQGTEYHARHCIEHAHCAFCSVWGATEHAQWLSDLSQPNIVHAALRAFFCLWSHKRGVK